MIAAHSECAAISLKDTRRITIKKLVLSFDQKCGLNSCSILINDCDVFNVTRLINNYAVGNRYIFDLNLMGILPCARIKILIKISDQNKNSHMNVLFLREKEFRYEDGMIKN